MDILELSKIEYPQEKVPLWSIPCGNVLNFINRGRIPQIRLPEFSYDNSRPKIAIILAQDIHPDRVVEDYTVFPDYVDAVIEAGANPYFIAYDYVDEQLKQISPDGILLIGGNFRLIKNHAYDTYERRPFTYVKMIDYAARLNIPTFAICGGEQMLGVYKGAKVQLRINNGLTPEQSHKQNPYKFSHNVILQEGSLLYKIMGCTTIEVNSCHNSALLADVMGDCKITGVATDGTVEAIEMYHPWSDFVLAVQWHPERTAKIGDNNSKKMFTAFVEAANNYQKKTL